MGKRERIISKLYMKKEFTTLIKNAEHALGAVEKDVHAVVAPAQKNAFKKFPILFSLLVTCGMSATFLGFERLLLTISVLENYPVVMLVTGITILVFTGTLYKKLG